MNKIYTMGKFLDQPRLVGKFSKTIPTLLIGGGTILTVHHAVNTPKNKRRKSVIKDFCTLFGTFSTALLSTRGCKKLGIKGFSNNINLKNIKINNTNLINDFLIQNKVNENTSKILEKAKTKILKLSEIKNIYNDLTTNKNGEKFLKKLIPDPENITSKEIFSEIKNLSIMGLVPVLGGIAGGITGDRLTSNRWKEKVPNKIKEGTYQYLANIFLCNIGAGIALGIMEKAKIKSKSARAIGMITGIAITGIIGGSAIANKINKTIINPLINKHSKKLHKNKELYPERSPEMLDIGLHTDDIATVAVLSGLKWIEPALPLLYSISGYRAGIGYRNNFENKKGGINATN